jgi:hypothetical protein
VVVIVVGVIALVTYALTDPPPTERAAQRAVVTPGVAAQLSRVPPAVFDTVGADPGDTPLTPPTVLAGQPALRTGGKPEVLYIGAEYCPFCAAPLSVFPDTQTFSFVGSSYSSRYLAFTGVELYSDDIDARGSFARIATLTPAQAQARSRYGSHSGASSVAGATPFVDIGNRMVTSTAAFSPAVLAKQSQTTIAAGLSQADDPTTQAVVASANQLSAGICDITGQQPTSVCASKGVREAANSLGMS